MLFQTPCTFLGVDPSALKDPRPLFEWSNPPAITTVPVEFITMRDLRQWEYALCVFRGRLRFRRALITERMNPCLDELEHFCFPNLEHVERRTL